MQLVTTKKLAEMCGVSDANIRQLRESGTLEGIENDKGKGWLFDIEEPKNREYLDAHRKVAKENSQDSQEFTKENQQLDVNAFERIAQRIEELAKVAGKVELIQDQQRNTEKDLEHWKKEFYELQQKYNNLQNDYETLRKDSESKINQLEQDNKILKEQLEKKSSFLGLFKK
jgi:chromosome segregation ATPase